MLHLKVFFFFSLIKVSPFFLYLNLQILHHLLGVAGLPDLDVQDLEGMRNMRWSEGGLGNACFLSKRGTLFLAFCARILSKFSLLRNTVKVGVMLDGAILQLLRGSKMLFIFNVSDLAA